MAIQILGADGLTVLDVDSTSKAARATLYDTNGNPMSDVSSLGNVLNALNSAVTITLGGQSAAGFNVSGTSGTITLSFEATIDNSTWVALEATPTSGGAQVSSTSANGQWVAPAGGFYAIRARVSAISGGASMTVSCVATPGTSTIAAVTVSGTVTGNQGTPNTLANAWPVEVTDGTNVLGTSAHPVRTDPTGTTTQPVSGSVTVSGTVTGNQGTPNTLANAWPVEITDGTNGPVVVSPGATPADADDAALVVALSPNTPTPPAFDLTGTGSISALNGAVTWGTQGMSGQSIQILGTWSGTIAFQFSNDGGVTWWADEVQSAQGSSGIIESTTANGMWFSTGLGGYRQYRVFATAWSSGTANITWDAGVGNNALSTVTNIVDGVGNGPAAVTVASTAAVATQQSLVVGLSPNSPLYDGNGNPMPVKNRVAMPSTLGVLPASGLDVGLVNRIMRVGELGTLRTTSEILAWHDALEGSTVNAFWTQSTTTMTIAQATGVLTLNNSSITTANTDAIVTSQRQFPKYPKIGLHARFKANITANVAANQTLVEFGFGAPSGVTAVINNGAFFRVTAAGNLVAVTSYNGTETVSATLIAQGSLSTTDYYRWDIFIEDQFARFIVTDANDIPVVDSQFQIPLSQAAFLAVSHVPTFARVYTTATGGGTAIQLKVGAHDVQLLDGLLNKPWGDQLSSAMRQASINPTSYAQTPSSFTAAPATLTPANASAGYAALGGEFAFATVVGFETGASIFGFQIPTPYTFYLTGLTIPPPVVATTISVTGVPYIEWLIAANATTNLLSTGGGFRQGAGIVHASPTASSAQGTMWNGGVGSFKPTTPIACLPGTFLHIGFKILGTTAVTTAGLHRGTVTVDGYFE